MTNLRREGGIERVFLTRFATGIELISGSGIIAASRSTTYKYINTTFH